MPQVSLYIEQDVLDAARRNARIKSVSLSNYVTGVLADEAQNSWPQGYWELFGALDDDSFTRPADVPFDSVGKSELF